MNYINSPIHFIHDSKFNIQIERPILNIRSVIDNWIDIVVFTDIRRFRADQDFGFGFWDNQYIAMNLVDFNYGTDFKIVKRNNNYEEKIQMSRTGIVECEKSIINSIAYYIPYLKDIEVCVQLSMEKNKYVRKGENSKYVVKVVVKGSLIYNVDELSLDNHYCREVEFFMDPFLNNR